MIKGWGDYHDWLDIAAAILFFIPGGQPISLGIEIINAAGYAAEGDFMMGGSWFSVNTITFRWTTFEENWV